MAKKIIGQFQWTTGEVDVINWKRTDVPFYNSAAQSLLNNWIGTTGLFRKRNGFEFLSDVTTYAIPTSALFELSDRVNTRYVQMADDEEFHIFDTEGAFIQTLVTPYADDQIVNIDSTLSNDVLAMAHPLYPPAQTYITAYNDPLPPTFAYAVLNIDPYPAFDFNRINYNGFAATLTAPTATTIQLVLGPLASDPGFTTEWVGGQIIGAGDSVTDPLGYASITSVTPWDGTNVTFEGLVQIPFNTTNPATTGAQYSIRQPAWSDDLGWPSKILFYQNRLWLANTESLENTLFASKINAPINFDVGVGNDTDAIVYSLGQNDSGPIVGLNGGKQLEVYTQNFEFAAPQDQNAGLTPSTFAIRQQSAYGSSSVCKPLTYVNDSYFINKSGNAIINFHFDGVGLAYTATNVSQAALHLVKNPTNRAIIKGSIGTQDNFIFYLNPDHTITTFQFAHETNLAALTPMDFNTQVDSEGEAINPVQIIDLVTINNTLYVLKFFNDTGKYSLERMDENTKLDSFTTATMATSGLITGLSFFEGYTVYVLFEGQNLGFYTVAGAQITVDNPSQFSGSVTIGLNYYQRFESMYFFTGPTETDYFKNVSRVFVDYANALGFNVNGKLVPFQTFSQIQAGLPLTPQTGTAIVALVNGWSRYSTLVIDNNNPYDLWIMGIRYETDSNFR